MIIICECKSYEFDIPDSELPKKNTIVQCSLCGKEWYQDFKNNKIISDKKQINPSKINRIKFECRLIIFKFFFGIKVISKYYLTREFPRNQIK